ALDAERAHQLTLAALDRVAGAPLLGAVATCAMAGAPISDPVELLGLRFPNRIGLAAGLDKDARHIDGLAALGFGFLELGTVTPLPQPGNPRPRLFRLPQAEALINRFGFNNDGIDRFVMHVRRSRTWQAGQRQAAASGPDGADRAGVRHQPGQAQPAVLGLNIGKNAATPLEQAAGDYLACLRQAMP